MAVRVTLFDGDTGPGDFDDGVNTLFVNGVNLGDWSAVTTQNHDAVGTPTSGPVLGFGDDETATGFFFSNDLPALATLFASMVGTQTVTFDLDDTSPDDNFYDFTQGVDGGFVNVGTGPVINPPMSAIPEPTNALTLAGLLCFGLSARRRNK